MFFIFFSFLVFEFAVIIEQYAQNDDSQLTILDHLLSDCLSENCISNAFNVTLFFLLGN